MVSQSHREGLLNMKTGEKTDEFEVFSNEENRFKIVISIH